jgi:ubiquitin fusion degradation protein 1
MMSGKMRDELNHGGKIIMPPSALEQLASLNIVYPMLFQLTHSKMDRVTHCGVLEFVAEEGRIYVPYWIMQQLLLEEGDLVVVKNVSLPVGHYVKIQPQTANFLNISDPKAVLENSFRSFACLTKGDVIAIHYNRKLYELLVVETKPGDAISIIEADIEVEFVAPVDYEEPKKSTPSSSSQVVEPIPSPPLPLSLEKRFQAFHGQGQRLSGKPVVINEPSVPVAIPK